MKKIISIFLAVLSVLCMMTVAFAVDKPDYAATNAIEYSKLKYNTEASNSVIKNYGGTFYYCDAKKEAFTYSEIKSDNCPKCEQVKDHEAVTIFYATKCSQCGTLNCAYDTEHFLMGYSEAIKTVTPDGSKVNECSVCGHIFDEDDLYDITTVTEIIPAKEEGEEPTTKTTSTYVNKYFRVYNCSEETMEALGKADTDVSFADYQSKATGSKVLGYLALPFIKMFRVATFFPGYLLDVLFYFVGDLVAGLL